MAEVEMKSFKFKNLRYDLNETVPKEKQLTSRMNVQAGVPSDGEKPAGAVRIRFRLESPESSYLSLQGEAEAQFLFPDRIAPVTTELVYAECWPLAYEEFRKRVKTITGILGELKPVDLKPFEQLNVESPDSGR